MPGGVTTRRLEALYAWYNAREHVHPDPVELVHGHADVADREVAALVVSALAFGRVRHILASASRALEILGPPSRAVRGTDRARLGRAFSGFRHRFVDGGHVASLAAAAGRIVEAHGSLKARFCAGLGEGDADVLPALSSFANALIEASDRGCGFLVPDPAAGSAMKRLNLMLRWLVRCDAVDPGGWTGVPTSKLIVPLDTHMMRLGVRLGFTSRRSADMRAALEITEGFRRHCPEDPVRYDFALTRRAILGHAALP